ncbi:MAG: Dabb family protein [Rhodoglobus sp.]
MIRHTVAFRLVHPAGSAEEEAFLDATDALGVLPGVERWEKLRQVGAKNDYQFGLSMEFADQSAYDGYSNHPDHIDFVNNRWMPEVAAFVEIDYEHLG